MSAANEAEDRERRLASEHLSQLAAYDERLRARSPLESEDGLLELAAPQLTKAMRALRDVLAPAMSGDDGHADLLASSVASSNSTVAATASSINLPSRFDLIEELGSGGFGIVYRANDLWLKREVAIKVLRPELLSQPALQQRFLREARAAARLNHPNIVRVLEVSEGPESIWQVSELVEGATLSQHVSQGNIEPRVAARLIRDLVDAVAHAHTAGVLHRDIKPSNILVNQVPGQPLEKATLHLTDFGLARLTDLDTTTLSHTGMLVGTPRYMAPSN